MALLFRSYGHMPHQGLYLLMGSEVTCGPLALLSISLLLSCLIDIISKSLILFLEPKPLSVYYYQW